MLTDNKSFRPKCGTAGCLLTRRRYYPGRAAENNSALALRVDRDGPRVLAEVCAASNLPLIHISTDYVFDGAKSTPYDEQDQVRPVGTYGLSRGEAGEKEIRHKHHQHIILRTAQGIWALRKNFLKTMVNLAATRDSRSGVRSGRRDTQQRPRILQRATLRRRGITSGDARWGTYHFAGAAEGSWHAFASDIIAEQAKYTAKAAIKPLTSAVSDTRASAAELASEQRSFASTFGYRAKPWQERVPSIVEALWAGGTAREGRDEGLLAGGSGLAFTLLLGRLPNSFCPFSTSL